MARLKIKDAPLLPVINGDEKIPTGGNGDFTLTPNMLAEHFKSNSGFATDEELVVVDNKLKSHTDNKNNPHQTTKEQVGLGNVNNTSDVDKPVSNATSIALSTKADKSTTYTKSETFTKQETNSLVSPKADKSTTYSKVETDNLVALKADKLTTYTKTEVDSEFHSIYQNGAALPYDAAMEYAEGAVVVKDGELQKKQGASWVSATNKGYNLDYFIGGKSYPLHAEIMLANGVIVKSTVANNTKNPNVDMTGWVKNNFVSYVDNISELRAFRPRKNKEAVFTLGFFEIGKGSSLYVFDDSISASDNAGEYIRVAGVSGAWVLQPNSREIQIEQFGAGGDGVTSDAAAIRRASAYAEKHNLKIVGKSESGYFIDSNCDIYNDLDLSHLVLSAHPTNYGHLLFKTRKIPETISIAGMSGLNDGSAKVTGFPLSAVGKYIRITSDAVFTERNGGATQYAPYTKNTTFNLFDTTGSISPSLDMSFSAGDNPTISIIPFERTMRVRIGKVSSRNGGIESIAYIGLLRDSIEFHIDYVDSTAQFRTLISNQGNNNKFYGSVSDINIDGYGYGISIANTCDTYIYDFKGYKGRTELDGRHGSNVFVYNSKFKSAGSHWGNNYVFTNCEIVGVRWSGKDLSFEGGVIHSDITSRTDLHLCKGKFYANNVTHHGVIFLTVSGDIPYGFFSTPRCFFNEVVINNLKCTANISMLFGIGTRPLAEFKAPSYISIKDIYAPNATRLSIFNLPLDDALAFTTQHTLNIENIYHGGVCRISGRGFTRNVSTFGYKATISNCGRIEIHADSNYLQDLDAMASEIVSARRVNPSAALGRWIFNNCKFKRDDAISTILFSTASANGFLNCEYDGDMTGINNLGPVLFSLNCKATLGSTNYPTPLKAGYVNPTYYIDA